MSSALLHLAVDAERHVGARLDHEPTIWLGTVSASGRPHTVPVWFIWKDPKVTIFSQPATAKLGHLRANGAVSLALDSAQGGTDIVLGEGRAELKSLDQVRDLLPTFARKYQPMLADQPIEQWLETFSQPILVTVDKLIAWTKTADGLDYRSLAPWIGLCAKPSRRALQRPTDAPDRDR